jgi:hypothetical protein
MAMAFYLFSKSQNRQKLTEEKEIKTPSSTSFNNINKHRPFLHTLTVQVLPKAGYWHSFS